MDHVSMVELNLIKPTQRFNNELSIPCQPFDFSNPEFDIEEFTKTLAETMVREDGIGLAANQVGVPYRVFTVRSDPLLVCYNPKIVDLSGEELLGPEGCLSFPGLSVKVKRWEEVRLRFQNYKGTFVTRKFGGLAARVVQHEMDHLDGILFFNRANRYHRDQAFKRLDRTLRKSAL